MFVGQDKFGSELAEEVGVSGRGAVLVDPSGMFRGEETAKV